MKSYTDIEQSKKLVEILPLESADTLHCIDFDGDLLFTIPKQYSDSFRHQPELIIPCWSLSALYSILPNNKKETTTLSRGGWKIEPIEYLNNWWCEYEDENHTKDFTVSADNPVDACVGMILKLNELNLL